MFNLKASWKTKKVARATWNDTVLAESEKYESVEGHEYFPPDSVKWEYLKPGTQQYTCPWKGKAAYYDIVVKGEVNRNAAWNYPEPLEAAKFIKGYVAFDTMLSGGGVKVEEVKLE
jgi:uncharacterized protein (DUF427 family)